MENNSNTRTRWIVATTLAAIGAVAWSLKDDGAASSAGGPELQLSSAALAGKPAYDTNCSGCHGANGTGTDKGPPLAHAVYNPGHHSDTAFERAIAQGVRQHHWRFGDMPALPQVTATQLQAIVRYVRVVQEARGITFQPHKM